MSRCPSCDVIVTSTTRTKIADGTVIIEEFCKDCLNRYVKNVDSLDYKEYAFEYSLNQKPRTNFCED